MAVIILALFIGVPILEIALFIMLGDKLGLFATLGLVILTAVIGTALLRWQGMSALAKARGHLGSGEMPVEEVFTGVFLLVAGALLLTPGFFTDAVGFALFVPGIRRRIGKALFDYLLKHGTVHVHGSGFSTRPNADRNGVIDGDYEDISGDDDDRSPPQSGQGWGRLPK